MKVEEASVLEQTALGGDYRLLKFASKTIAPEVRPGQFIHLRISDRGGLTLRRPFSVYKADGKCLAIIYKIVGCGTKLLADLKAGDRVSIMGPLGNGFPATVRGELPVLVAGGYGAAALCLLAEQGKTKGIIFIGAKSAEDILCAGDFDQLGWETKIATEDGSIGRKGLVTDLLKAWLQEAIPPTRTAQTAGDRRKTIYACGPMGMLKAVSGIAVAQNIKAWLSLDTHMGCGVGACLACVQKVKDGENGWKWARVCADGPVFECREIVWD